MAPVPSKAKAEESNSTASRGYEPPRVEWEEDFEPAGQVTGCADVGDSCPERPET